MDMHQRAANISYAVILVLEENFSNGLTDSLLGGFQIAGNYLFFNIAAGHCTHFGPRQNEILREKCFLGL